MSPLQQVVVFFAVLFGVVLSLGALYVLRRRRALRADARAPVPAVSADWVEGAIQARDFNFRLEDVLGHVRFLDQRLREARRTGDAGPLRRHVSDGVLAALAFGASDASAVPETGPVRLTVADLEHSRGLDVLHVRVERGAAEPASRAAGSERTEYWSFARTTTARTLVPAAAEEVCPSCLEALPPGGAAQCPACRTLLNDGTFAWVLVEITPAELWFGVPSSSKVPGLAALTGEDSWLSRVHLEDRAVFLLTRWHEAQRSRSTAPLERFAVRSLVDPLRKAFAASAGTHDPGPDVAGAIGPSALFGVDPGVEDELDFAYVRVAWRPAVGLRGAVGWRQSNVVLSRGPEAATLPGVRGDVCDSCGRLLDATEKPQCEHCGTVVEPGRLDWALERVDPDRTPISWRRGAPGASDDAERVEARRAIRRERSFEARQKKFAGLRGARG